MQEDQMHQQVDKRDSQSREAIAAGREDLARAALERKQLITGEVGSLDQQISDLEGQQQQLTDAENKLQTKIQEFRSKKEAIKAQYSAAEAQVHIPEAATATSATIADPSPALHPPLHQ